MESDYYENISNRCQQERLAKHRMWSWGSKDEVSGLNDMIAYDTLNSVMQYAIIWVMEIALSYITRSFQGR